MSCQKISSAVPYFRERSHKPPEARSTTAHTHPRAQPRRKRRVPSEEKEQRDIPVILSRTCGDRSSSSEDPSPSLWLRMTAGKYAPHSPAACTIETVTVASSLLLKQEVSDEAVRCAVPHSRRCRARRFCSILRLADPRISARRSQRWPRQHDQRESRQQ